MKLTTKTIFVFFILVALFLSIIVGIQRFELENDFKQVEMVMSLNKLRELSIRSGYDEDDLLSQLKQNGISSIAIHEDTIEDLSFSGRITYLDTNDLTQLNWIHNVPFFGRETVSPGEFLILCRDEPLFQRIKKFLKSYLDERQLQEYPSDIETYALKLQGDEEEMLKTGIGFSPEDIEKVASFGFNIILRPKNPSKVTSAMIQEKLSDISDISETENISTIIFDEEEVLGYPSAKMIAKTTQFLKENQYHFGIIEFTSQKGIYSIASGLSDLAVRVHSITKEELETMNITKAIDRWIRGAQERNIRLFYLNPLLNRREGDLVNQNMGYIQNIKEHLDQNGFTVGKASLFPTYQIPLLFIFIIGLGIVSAGILFLGEFIDIVNRHRWALLIIGNLLLFFIYIAGGVIFLTKILALLAALTFPVLAIVESKGYFLPKKDQGEMSNHDVSNIRIASYPGMIKNIFFGITKIMLISLAGGLMIGALLTHYKFILGIELFSGIKIAYIFPLLIVAGYLWWISQKDKILLIKDLKKPILFEHAFLVFIFLVFLVIYISRSGNFSFLPVPGLEEKMRVFLENILVARPRSKEFLIGYPLLSLAMAMNYFHIPFLKYPIIIMGTVAPVTIVNTFCHVHTAISFSLLRTFHGYWLGIVFGIFLVSIFFLFNMLFRIWLNGSRK